MTICWLVASVDAAVCSTAAAAVIYGSAGERSESDISISVAYAFLVPYFLGQTMNYGSMLLLMFASLERLLEFSEVVQEETLQGSLDANNLNSLGSTSNDACIELIDVKLRYHLSLPLVLRGVSLFVANGEKVGICGRTGAGKSSLISALFRLVGFDGQVLIGGVDTKQVRLSVLRSWLAIVPQSPIILRGNLASNIDPFNESTELEVAQALAAAGLARFSLDEPVEPGGSNFSAGERQLICFARVLVMRRKVVVMDEPTSNIDAQTDEQIQQITRESFKGTTLLCIAHRLTTIADYDRVLVMDSGEVVEFGAPAQLLSNGTGHFTRMVRSLGHEDAERVVKKAHAEPMSSM